ncbi:MAG: sulfurtransferase [Bacteroidetes bacterium]|nr:MAG: sulfurtransferase [Bacteroidota bacterium]
MPGPQSSLHWTTLVGATELSDSLDDPNLVIVDCRFALADAAAGRTEFDALHIVNARYANLDEDLSGPIIPGETGRHPLPSVKTFEETLGRLGIDHSSQVVVYDGFGGAFASRLWWLLQWVGHGRVAVLDGGWQRWIGHEFATTAEQPTYSRTEFRASIRNEMQVSAEEVEQVLDNPDWRILDARDVERYRGEFEPIDPVSGHIPGALSAPFKENLDAEQCFLSPEILRARFESIVGQIDPEHTISYCGSGVTGAHNALAMKHAGLGMPRLYAGSWSEWITDTSRPIAVGNE